MKKGFEVKLISFLLAAVAIMSGIAITGFAKAAEYKKGIENVYMSAMSVLISSVSDLNVTMQKFEYTGSPEMKAMLAAQMWRHAAEAKSAVSVLPFEVNTLEATKKFISQSGDYAFALLKNYASGQPAAEEEQTYMTSLSQTADKLSAALHKLKVSVDDGSQSIYEPFSLFGENTDSKNTEEISMDDGFPEYVSLVYDGQFSDHIDKMEPLFLKDKAPVSQNEALKTASEISGIDENELAFSSGNESGIKTYCFSAKGVYVEITQQGGIPINYINSSEYKSEQAQYDMAALAKNAVEFAEKCGFHSLKETYYNFSGNVVNINFAYEENGIIYYPDLVEISLYTDTGSIAALNANGYVMNHHVRVLPSPAFSKELANEKIGTDAAIQNYSLCVIPTDGKNEILCHEFLITDDKGKNCVIYINAENGVEERVDILLENDSGKIIL